MKFKSILCSSLLVTSVSMMFPISQAQAQSAIGVKIAPPAPRYERVPPPRAGFIWTPGYWSYAGRRHVWVPGQFVRVRPGYRYSAPRWHRDARGYWTLHTGAWKR
jgi:hypothetical protein